MGESQLQFLPSELKVSALGFVTQRKPRVVSLCREFSWAALQGLYKAVKLKSIRTAAKFFRVLERNCISTILNKRRADNPGVQQLAQNQTILLDNQAGNSPPQRH
jgi:hypothetical protein